MRRGDKLGSAYLLPMPTDKDNVDYDLIVLGQMPDAEIEVGYFLKPSAWDQGFATEVCRRMLQFAFQEASFKELVASVHADNFASQSVLKKTGFRYRGQALCWGLDTPLYEISRGGWNELQGQNQR